MHHVVMPSSRHLAHLQRLLPATASFTCPDAALREKRERKRSRERREREKKAREREREKQREKSRERKQREK